MGATGPHAWGEVHSLDRRRSHLLWHCCVPGRIHTTIPQCKFPSFLSRFFKRLVQASKSFHLLFLFQEQIHEWSKQCVDTSIPCSSTISLAATLGDPVQIRNWNICGLPTDNFSIDNGKNVFKIRFCQC